jgi:hypothetical protein
MDNSKRNKSDGSGPFDSRSGLSLVSGTISRNSTGNNLTSFRYKIPEHGIVLIVYREAAISTETAHFVLLKCFSPSAFILPFFQQIPPLHNHTTV